MTQKNNDAHSLLSILTHLIPYRNHPGMQLDVGTYLSICRYCLLFTLGNWPIDLWSSKILLNNNTMKPL